MRNLIDTFLWEEKQKLVTFNEHGINGLGNLSYYSLTRAKTPLEPHYHENMLEIHCMIKGKRFVDLNGKDYEIKGKEMLLTFPGEVHSTGDRPQSPSQYYAFQVDLSNKDRLLGLDTETSHRLAALLLGLEHHLYQISEEAQSLLKWAFERLLDESNPDLEGGVRLLTSFLFLTGEALPAGVERGSFSEPIQRCVEFIESHINEPYQLSDLSEIAGYSLSFFKIKFKEETGMTPLDYIVSIRVEHAKKLLEATEKSVAEISSECGFSSGNYFSTVFKKCVSLTPKEYRAKALRDRNLASGSEYKK